MSEKELDSSINEYIETETLKNYVKQLRYENVIGKKLFMKLNVS